MRQPVDVQMTVRDYRGGWRAVPVLPVGGRAREQPFPRGGGWQAAAGDTVLCLRAWVG